MDEQVNPLSADRATTLRLAIERLAKKGNLGDDWETRKAAVGSWKAAQDAIWALRPNRCNRLRSSEVAVICDRADRQMSELLRNDFMDVTKHPNHQRPRDFHEIKVKKDKAGPRAGLGYQGVAWVFRRKTIETWWEDQLDSLSGKRAEAARSSWISAKRRRLSTPEQKAHLAEELIKRLKAKQAKLNAAIEEEIRQAEEMAHTLALSDMREWMARTTRSLAGVMRDQHRFVINAAGSVHDHARLPISTAQEIAALLTEGASIETMTLDAALRLPWVDMSRWDTWRAVWDQAMTNAAVSLNAHRADHLARNAGTHDSAGRKGTPREKPRD